MDRRRRPKTCAVLSAAVSLLIGCDEPPRSVVFEGKLPTNLTFQATASLGTRGGSFFCTKNWLSARGARTKAVGGKLQRLSDGRYAFDIDLEDAPHGGLCGWQVTMVGGGVQRVDDPLSLNTPVILLKPDESPRKAGAPPAIDIRCRPHLPVPDARYVRCDPSPNIEVDSFSGDTHIELNVRWDPTPWYPPEWDTYPEYRPDGWKPGMPMPRQTL